MKLERKLKIITFALIKQYLVEPKGIELNKTDDEINAMAMDTLEELICTVNYEKENKKFTHAEKLHQQYQNQKYLN